MVKSHGNSGLVTSSTASAFLSEPRFYTGCPRSKKPERSKFAGTGIEGIFLGYHIQPGFIFNDEYLVAPLHNIANALENEDLRVFRAKRLEIPDGGFKFPLLTEPAVDKLPNLDDQHHNVLEANNPHPPTEEGGGYTEAEIQEQLSNDLDDLFPELFGPET